VKARDQFRLGRSMLRYCRRISRTIGKQAAADLMVYGTSSVLINDDAIDRAIAAAPYVRPKRSRA
jgi:hypothetical protein